MKTVTPHKFLAFYFCVAALMFATRPCIAEDKADKLQLISSYQKWTKANLEPAKISSVFSATACAPASPSTNQLENGDPHRNRFITVFVNNIGKEELLTRKTPHFPAGTVIVKEKSIEPALNKTTIDNLTPSSGTNNQQIEFRPLHGTAAKQDSNALLTVTQLDDSKQKLLARDLLTVMVKHKAGFDPAHGDWEYFSVNGTGNQLVGSGKNQSCQECHQKQESEDYVFRRYIPSSVWDRMK